MIEVVVLRCYPSDAPTPPLITAMKASSRKESDDDEVPTLMGAMFDGAGDPKPRLFDVDSASNRHSSSTTVRRSRRKPKPEKIEIHNSNVHIYNTANKDSESSKPSRRRRHSKQHTDTSYGYNSYRSVSPRAHLASQQARSAYNRRYSGSSGSPIMQLRGGAPGSYGGSPTNDKPAGDAWDATPGSFPADNTAWNADADLDSSPAEHVGWDNNATLGPPPVGKNTGWNTDAVTTDSEIENNAAGKSKGWEPKSSDLWTPGTTNAEPKPWIPVEDAMSKKDVWAPPIEGPQAGIAGASGGWDPTTVTEKRDAWGDLIKEDTGNAENTEGAFNWTSFAHTESKADDSSKKGVDARGGWGNDDAGQGDDNKAQTNTWGPPISHESNKDARESNTWNEEAKDGAQTNGWATAKDDDEEVKMGSSATAAPSVREPWDPTKTKTKTKSWGSWNTAKGKEAKTGSVVSANSSTKSKARKPWVPILKTTTQKPNEEVKASVEDSSREDKTPILPGSWSPPLYASRPKDSSARHKETNKTPETVIAPIHSIAKPPQPKAYWSTWNHSDTPVSSKSTDSSTSNPSSREEEPIYNIPSTIASHKNLTHQVRPMRASEYSHRLSTPRYMDSHDDPYAVFVFQYRDQAVVERMLGRKLDGEEMEEKRRLAALSKEEIIEELLKARAGVMNGGGGGSGPAANGTVNQGGKSEPLGWGSFGSMPPISVPKPPESLDVGAWGNNFDNWGKNPKGAGPWKSPGSINGSKVAKGQRTQNGTDNGGNGWNNNDDDSDNSDDGGGGDNDWKNNGNNSSGGEKWGNDQNGNGAGAPGESSWGNNDDSGGGGGSWNKDGQTGGDDAGGGGGAAAAAAGGAWGGESAKNDAGGGNTGW